MTGDFSRTRALNARQQGYAGVLMQQGRLYTDSDWNENLAIQTERTEDALRQLIGASATPRATPGFAISPAAGGFTIGAGSFWVDGLRVDNPQPVSDRAQHGLALPPFTDQVADGGEMLIYLEVRKEIISAQDDPLLLEAALEGADTAVRVRAQWRVAVRPLALDEAGRTQLMAQAACGRLPDFADWRAGTGRLRVQTVPPADTAADDCMLVPDAGYQSQENQLYRVAIVKGGSRAQARFVWSRENAAVVAGLRRNADGEFALVGARADEALGFASGDVVEVFDARDRWRGQPGRFARLTLVDGVASFAPAIADFDTLVRPQLRRWDHVGDVAGLPLGTAVALERGIEASFSDGNYVVGDVWLFEARAAIGDVVWPPIAGAADTALAPMGWGRRRAPLALARRAGDGLTGLVDLRPTFPALACLSAADIRFDDGNCGMDATTVQQALDALCQRKPGGLCTAVVGNAAELQAAVAAARPGASIRLCLAGGAFALPETLVLRDLGHVTVAGTGPQTVLSVAAGEAALRFENCASVRVHDLAVNGGPSGRGTAAAGRQGALAMVDCGDIHVERVRLRCRAGPERAAACLSSVGRRGRVQEVRVRDCDLKVGQGQIGIQVVDASRTHIAGNRIAALPAPGANVAARIAADRVARGRMANAILRFRRGDPETAFLDVRRSEMPFADRLPEMGDRIREAEVEFAAVVANINHAGHALRLFLLSLLGESVLAAIRKIEPPAIASEADARRHLRGLLRDATGNGGIARMGGRAVQLLPDWLFRAATTPFMAEAIVIAGAAVEVAEVTGNHILDANDGIRIAASTAADPRPAGKPAAWRQQMPANHVAHATVSGNVIRLNPLSNVTAAHGIFLGHVGRARICANSITLARRALWPGLADAPDAAPQHGIRQHGWRGRQLLVADNEIAGIDNGITIGPVLQLPRPGLWSLRANAIFETRRALLFDPAVRVD